MKIKMIIYLCYKNVNVDDDSNINNSQPTYKDKRA